MKKNSKPVSRSTALSDNSPFHFQHVIRNLETGECRLFPDDDVKPLGTIITFTSGTDAGTRWEVIKTEYEDGWQEHFEDYIDPDWKPFNH